MSRRVAAAAVRQPLIGFLTTAALALLLLIVIAFVQKISVTDLDTSITLSLRKAINGSAILFDSAAGITILGNTSTLWLVVLVVTGCLISFRAWVATLQLIIVTGSGGMLTRSIKLIVGRPRPSVALRLAEAYGPSFPSGHAMNSAFVYGTLAMIASQAQIDARLHRPIGLAAVLVILLIGSSRVILGVHWTSDVLAGWVIGLSWALLGAHVAAVLRR